MNAQLIDEVRQALADHGDSMKAQGMQAYMKSEMPYRGVQTPLRRKLVRAIVRAHPFGNREVWRETVLELWRAAAYREERYAALEVAGAPRYRAYRDLGTLPMFEEMVITGAWWDLVDDIATHRLRELLEQHPDDVAVHMRSWSRDDDLWKRRSSIICQVNRREETDLSLLFHCIEPNMSDTDFFIRKAIGWALRDLAWSRLDVVEDYVARNADRLSVLSRREALKNASAIRGTRGQTPD